VKLSRKAVAVSLALLAAGVFWWARTRPQTYEISFVELPVEGPLDWEPRAPDGFPDCSPENSNIVIEDSRSNASATIRPKEGVQCGLQVGPPSWVVDAAGERVDLPPIEGENFRMLLMGPAGASGGIYANSACGLTPPLTLVIELAGEPFEIGEMRKPECHGQGLRLRPFDWYYRGTNLESPAGWLDVDLTGVPEIVAGETLRFRLTMTNGTDDPIVIGRCPFFDARFSTDAGNSRLRSWVNCPGAPDEISPGDVFSFAIEMTVPAGATRGGLEVDVKDERRTLHRIEGPEIEVRL
jgi:hypothetical protein